MLTSAFEDEIARFKTTKACALASPDPPCSLAEVKAFEEAHGFCLPSEYIEVATRLGTGEVGFANVFSVGAGHNSISSQRNGAPELPSNFIPVSDNGCGDFYGFVVHGGRCGSEVYFADHESEFEVSRTEFADLYEYLVRHGFNAA